MSSPAQRRLVFAMAVLCVTLGIAWFLWTRRAPAPARDDRSATTAPATPAPPIAAPGPDFRGEAEAARALVNPAQRAREFGRNLAEWIARDPDTALAYVRGLPPGADYTQGLLMVLSALGRTDPDRALALAAELVKTREQRAIYSALFAQLVAADPTSAVARLARVPAGESLDYAVRALADGWSRVDQSAALAWAQKQDAAIRGPAMESVLASLATTDPLRAIELAQDTLTGPAFDRTLLAAVQALTRTDPKAAGALVSKLAPGEVQTLAAYAVGRALAAENPVNAVAWVRTLPAGELQTRVLNNVLDLWATKDPIAASQFVVQLPAGPEQDAAAAHLARLLAANPVQAIAWAQSLAGASARSAVMVNLASAWAVRDPAAATQWAGSIEPAAARVEALNGALSYWVLQDSAAARNYIYGLTGETQVSAAAHLAPGLAQRDPVGTMTWAQTLPTPEAREATTIAAYARWRQNAPAAAQAWLAGANLPAETKAKLAAP